MPIRVNLKEIFPSDPQEINVDKVNFNFNKLLELGVGTPGPIGSTGPIGPAGPVGLAGPQGDRGATWWVDAGDPNLLTFTGLIDGDLYLDTVSFNAWQYDETTSTWTKIASISTIVNTYLSSISAGLSPFVTGLGIDPPVGSPSYKYVTFRKRGNPYSDYTNDTIRGALNTSNNYVLFLNNFDEKILYDNLPTGTFDFPSNPNELYDSILKVFVSHANAATTVNYGRYHLELGSLYDDSGVDRLSTLSHNLKVKFLKQDVTSSTPIPATNTWINTARFSLAPPDPTPSVGIDQNGTFEFITPKWNNQVSPSTDVVRVLFGSYESHVEQGVTFNHIKADGITITLSTHNTSIGIAKNYVSANTKLNNKTHFMLDASSSVNGTILLNKGIYVNGDANIVNGLAIGSSYSNLTSPSNGLIVQGTVGIGTSSPGARLDVNTGNTTANSIAFRAVDSSSAGFYSVPKVGGVANYFSIAQLNDTAIIGTTGETLIIGAQNGAAWRFKGNSGSPTGGEMHTDANIGVGTDSPTARLHVVGEFRLQDGSEVANSYLSGDANGNTSFLPISNIVPVGAVLPYYGSVAPTGWLICDGSQINSFLYPALDAHLIAMGSYITIGAVNIGVLPDLRGLFIAGAGGTYTLGQEDGANAVALTKTNIPPHKHGIGNNPTDPTIEPGATLSNGSHSHTYDNSGSVNRGSGGNATADDHTDDSGITGGTGAHVHTGTTGNGTFDGLSGTAHENRPPFMALTYIMKT